MQPAGVNAGAPYVVRARAALEAAARSSPEPQRLASPISGWPPSGALLPSPTASQLLSGHHAAQPQLPLVWSTPPSKSGLLTPQTASLGLFPSPQHGCLASPWQAFGFEQPVHGQDKALPDLQPGRTQCHLTPASLHMTPLEKLQAPGVAQLQRLQLPHPQHGEVKKQPVVCPSGFEQPPPTITPAPIADQAADASVSGSGGSMAVRVQGAPWVKQEPQEVQQPLNGQGGSLCRHHPQQQTRKSAAGFAPIMQTPAGPAVLPGPALLGAGPMLIPTWMPGVTWMRGYMAAPVIPPQAVGYCRPPLIIAGAQPGSAFAPVGYGTPALPVRTRPAAATPPDSGPVGSMTQVACRSTSVAASLPQDAGGGSDLPGCPLEKNSKKRKAASLQTQAGAASEEAAAAACAAVASAVPPPPADGGALPTAALASGGTATAAPAPSTSEATVSHLGAAATASHAEHDVMARKREANRAAQQRFRERRRNTISTLEQQVAELREELLAAHTRCTTSELQAAALQQTLAERDEELASLQAALKAANSRTTAHTAPFAI